MNNLLIIGNGFDLACKIKSSFADFVKIYEQKFLDLHNCLCNFNESFNYKEFSDKTDIFTLIALYRKNFEKANLQTNWSDIEASILDFLTSKKKNFINLENIISNINKKRKTSLNSEVDFFIEYVYKCIQPEEESLYSLINFLNNQLMLFEKNLSIYLAKITINTIFLKNTKLLLNSLIKLISNTSNPTSIDLDSFNYTNLIGQEYSLIRNISHINGTIGSNTIGVDYSIIREKIDKSNSVYFYSSEDLLVFTKCIRRIAKARNKIKIKNSKNYQDVYVYGHSLNVQDYTYFISTFDNIKLYDLSSTSTFNVIYNDFHKNEVDNSNYFSLIKSKLIKLILAYEKIKNLPPYYLVESLSLEGRLNILKLDYKENNL